MNIANTKQTLLTCCVGALCLGTLSLATTVHANAVDEAAEACIEAARLVTEDDDLDGAIEEASWCITGLKQLKEEIKLSLLPDELDDFVGGEIGNENVLGMTSVTRVYTRDGESLTVTLMTTGGDAGALGGALGGLGELGKLFGALEGASPAGSGKKIRIQRRTVIVSDEGGTANLRAELKSGGSLSVESQDLDSDELIEFLREFPLAEIDDAIGE